MMERKTPKYISLINWLKEQMRTGQLKLGERLPSEKELCGRFGISRQTVRNAIHGLAREGYVESRRGSGTFVIDTGGYCPAHTMTIGVVTSYIDDYIFPNIIRGIETVLTQKKYLVQLAVAQNKTEQERKSLLMMLEKNVDGLIVEPTKTGIPSPNEDLFREIHAQGMPIVFVDSCIDSLDIPMVALDDIMAGEMATQYLIDMGHTDIGGLFQMDETQGMRRYRGYLKAMKKNHLPIREDRTHWFATEDIPTLFAYPARIMDRYRECTAIMCHNDKIAFQLCSFFAQNGIYVGQDISVIGIDNATLAEFCEPPLTTIDHPKELLGMAAAENLLKLIEDRSFDASLLAEAKVVERSSVKRRPAEASEAGDSDGENARQRASSVDELADKAVLPAAEASDMG